MAGKAVAVAKAVVKKPVAKAKKPVAKATAKVVAKAAKKPVATKATAKKPAVAKFNLNKLMMLIVRDAPKKGKKMMGGYNKASVQLILKLITDYLILKKERIIARINDVRFAITAPADNNALDDAIATFNTADPTDFIDYISALNKTPIIDQLRKDLVNYEIPVIMANNRQQIDKQDYDSNFMIIIIALCDVHYNFNHHGL